MTLNISTQSADKISTVEIYELKHLINVKALSKGTYLLRIFNDKKTLTMKFVKH